MNDKLPWWATIPREILFPPPASAPHNANKPTPRSRATVKRKQGPGRPSVMTDDMIKDAQRMLATGKYTADDIARQLGVSRSTVFRHRQA